MLKFDPINFPYQAEDKAHEFSTSIIDDPFNDLFNQYISQDSSGVGDNDNQSSIFDALDFPIDDTLSNGSSSNDRPLGSHVSPKIKRSQAPHQAYIRYTQSQETLPSPIYRNSTRFEKPQAAISGAELLNLEGKVPTQVLPVRLNSSLSLTATPVPPLRRKPRFSANLPETLRYRNHKVSKSSGAGAGEVAKMTLPYYRHEISTFQERFERISLQPPGAHSPSSSLSPEYFFRDEKQPRNVPSTRSSQQDLKSREINELCYVPLQKESSSKINEFGHVTSPNISSPFHDQTRRHQTISFNAHRQARSSGTPSIASPPPSLSPSWLQSSTSNESFDFIVSQNQVQSSWSPGFPEIPASCNDNLGASQSAPILPQSGPDFSGQYPIIQCGSFESFATGNLLNGYNIAPTDPFQPTDFEVAHPFPSQTASLNQPQTPSTRSSSPCQSPSPDSKPHSKSRRRSKTSRRKSSANALKSPTTGLGFVNFTPGDSQKILSGVAPSGSSKTKARREQEAYDKKRKLSLAAVKAVQKVGGDVETLRAAGVLV